MNTLRRLAVLAGIAGIFLTFGPEVSDGGQRKQARAPRKPPAPAPTRTPVGSIASVTEPMFRQVVQRRDDNFGNIVFMGTFVGKVDGFEARSILRPGMPGQAQGWAALDFVSTSGNKFIGVYRQAAGGFYDLMIRPTYRGEVGAASTVSAVGVGEVFITAGQSNSTNAGPRPTLLPDLRVSSFDDGPGQGIDPTYRGASWRWGIDPQPTIDNYRGSSVWPRMATNLASALSVPIGLYAAGCGGTTIEQWLPGTITPANSVNPQVVLFDRLANALNYFKYRGGVRAVLWDQGEGDTASGTDPGVYEVRLRSVIEQSRQVTGVPVKWMVALASGPPDAFPPAYHLALEQS